MGSITIIRFYYWLDSSVGRASDSYSEGQRFDSVSSHCIKIIFCEIPVIKMGNSKKSVIYKVNRRVG